MAFEYEHKSLPWQVQTISGSYRLQEEKLLECSYGLVLYLTGFGVVDNACCGVGGCSYALVPGLVLSHKEGTGTSGRPLSRLEAITDPKVKRDVAARIKERESVQQVLFQGD